MTVTLTVLVLLVGAAACSSDGDDPETVEAWCDTVEQVPTVVEDNSPTNIDEFSDLEDSMDALETLEAELADGAPESVREDVARMMETDPDTLKLSEREAYDEAQERVNTYIADECDLAVEL